MSGFRGSNIPKTSHLNQASHWHMNELTYRIVAESGIAEDRYHLGKIILQGLKEDPDFLLQIDGATDGSENCASVLKRSVQCANGLRKLGVKTGDVLILMAPNHLDLCIPFYAALYLGLTIAPIDRDLKVDELVDTFHIDKPAVIFCQNERVEDVLEASKISGQAPEIVTFDEGADISNSRTANLRNFKDFLQNYGNDVSVEDFRPTNFDPSTTLAMLLCTSGTTGKPKSAAIVHKSFGLSIPFLWSRFTTFPTPTRLAMIVSPLQWLTAIFHFLMTPIMRYTRLQSSLAVTQEHAYYLINKYRPTYIILSPTLMATLMNPKIRHKCDFTCFEAIFIGGSAVDRNLVEDLKKLTPKTEVTDAYGSSETTSMVFLNFNSPSGSCGKPIGLYQYRLVDPSTGKDIHEPNVPGELRVQSPVLFKGYLNDPEATEATFDDSWFMTGDIFYRDENWNFFFVDRLKQLLKYKNHQISPVEVEGVIRQHPSVLDVAVVGIPDLECGDLAVACVVTKQGHTVEAQEIKDLVKNTLTDTKQLRGGVVFMNELPLTATTKLHRQKLKEIVLTASRE